MNCVWVFVEGKMGGGCLRSWSTGHVRLKLK